MGVTECAGTSRLAQTIERTVVQTDRALVRLCKIEQQTISAVFSRDSCAGPAPNRIIL